MAKKNNDNSIKGIIDFLSDLKSFESVDTSAVENPGALLKAFEESGKCGIMDAANVCGLWTDNKTIAMLMQACYPDTPNQKYPESLKFGTCTRGSKYSTEYLKIVFKAVQALDYESVRLQTADDYPLMVTWTFTDNTHLWFILAPRVDND